MRDFADKNTVALSALRAQTWRRLQDSIDKTELASVLDEALIRDLMEAYENMLFARGHV